MFAKFKRVLGNVTVEVKNAIVRVEGIPADVMARDIKKIWGTGRIEQNLFNEIDDNSFSFYEFFAVDVVYAIDRMIAHPQARTAIRTLTKIKETIVAGTWLAGNDLQHAPLLNREKLALFTMQPLPFQAAYFDAYEKNKLRNRLRGMLLAGAAGSGKTFTSLAQVEMLECDKVIVVVPNNSINRVWEANLLGNFINPPSYWLSNGTVPFTGEEKYLVVTYEYLAKLLALLGKFKYRKLTILLDESHNFNEIKSLRTELFLTLCEKTQPSDVIWLSGTPIKALATEAIPLIRCIDPTFTPECEARFRKIFGVSSERASDMLKNRLDGLMFKIEKHELKLLPPIFREVKVVVPGSERYTLEAIRERMQAYMDERYTYYNSRRKEDEAFFYGCLKKHEDGLRTPKDKDAFREYTRCLKVTILSQGDVRFAKDEIIYCNKYETRVLMPSLPAGERKAFKDIKSIVKYVKLKVQGECLGRVVGRARIEAHMAMAPCIDYVTLIESTEKKTLVYTSFTEVINVLERMLPEMGLEPLFVYGKTNSQLAGIIKKFDEDENANPLVATYASLSTAVPLVMADVMLMIDAPWRDYQLQQTVSRINRLGSDTQCYVYTAVLDTGEKPNISTRSFDILKWSQQQVVALTGVQSPFEIGDDLEKAGLALEEYELSTGQLPQPAFLEW